MEILDGEAEGLEFIHCPAVILVAEVAITEIKVTNGVGVPLNTSELRHIRWDLLMAHVYDIAVRLFQDPMHVVGILFGTVFCLGLPIFYFVL